MVWLPSFPGAHLHAAEHSTLSTVPCVQPACPALCDNVHTPQMVWSHCMSVLRICNESVAQIGAQHLDVRIDSAVDAMAALFATITGCTPRFRVRVPKPPFVLVARSAAFFVGALWTQ